MVFYFCQYISLSPTHWTFKLQQQVYEPVQLHCETSTFHQGHHTTHYIDHLNIKSMKEQKQSFTLHLAFHHLCNVYCHLYVFSSARCFQSKTASSLPLPLILPFGLKERLNETAEGPTLWSITTLNGEEELDRISTKLKGSRGKEIVDGGSDRLSSLRINLTVVNSTYNYTTTQEVRTPYNRVCHL